MLAYIKQHIYICNIIIKTTSIMKLKINLKSLNSKEKYHTVIEIKEETICELFKDEVILKIFREERRIEKENNDTLIITGIS